MKSIVKLGKRFGKYTKSKNTDLKLVEEIFDNNWYLRSYPDVESAVAKNDRDAFKHFVDYGAAEGRQPNLVFNYNYISTNNTFMKHGNDDHISTLVEFAKSRGKALLKPHPLFDPLWYLQNYDDVRSQFIEGSTFPLKHYLTVGAMEGRSPNALFSASWYLDHYPDACTACEENNISPLEHYLNVGSRLQYSPSPDFDAGWYLRENSDVRDLVVSGVIDPLTHFIMHGRNEGRRIKSYASAFIKTVPSKSNSGTLPGDATKRNIPFASTHLWKLSEAPLVSIIVVNHNGAHHLNQLFQSLGEQTYKNFELVFVDNGSEDDSCKIVERSEFRKKIIKNNFNTGFAAANNSGVSQSSGELIAVLNNDTRLDPNWLEAMVNVLVNNVNVGAVTPKLRFWSKFINIKLTSQYQFKLERSLLIDCLDYKKVFVEIGHEEDTAISSVESNLCHIVSLNIPVQDRSVTLQLDLSTDSQIVSISSGFHSASIISGKNKRSAMYEYRYQTPLFDKYVINNAGSVEHEDGSTADRGFGEFDRGQYDNVEEIDLICGCAALVRRDALLGYDLFQGDFVAYYEDSELSKRIKLSGFSIVYCPLAIVYHKHSATSVEKSQFWMTYVNRNEALFKYMFAPQETRDQLLLSKMHTFQHHKGYFENAKNVKTINDVHYAASLEKIIQDLPVLSKKIRDGELPAKSAPRIGLFNNYWKTLGGGEAHALSLLQVLCLLGTVDIISVDDFCMESTLSYFGVSPDKIRKRLIVTLESEITAEYDIFVNSSYMNECPSLAKISYYIVSFPSKSPSNDFLRSYIFLANSEYTLSWMHRYWGRDKFEARILTPAVSDKLLRAGPMTMGDKSKLILSVGRFFRGGHSKNQQIIAQIFKDFIDRGGSEGWKLVLAGSSNDSAYVEEIRSALLGYDAEVLTNISLSELSYLYQSACIYVHASGYGKLVDSEPENFEHFGMTVVEAVLNGCLPIVYNAAGPKEIVETLGCGYCYESIAEATELLQIETGKYLNIINRTNQARAIRAKAESKFQVSGSVNNVKRLSELLPEILRFDRTNIDGFDELKSLGAKEQN